MRSVFYSSILSCCVNITHFATWFVSLHAFCLLRDGSSQVVGSPALHQLLLLLLLGSFANVHLPLLRSVCGAKIPGGFTIK